MRSRYSASGKPVFTSALLLCTALLMGSEQTTVRVEPTIPVGPRALEKQTESAVVRDYLQAWQSLQVALQANRSDLLNADFVGAAKEKLAATIRDQQQLGIQTRYADTAHDVKIVFYSPEGLSVELLDTVEYDVQLFDHQKPQATHHVSAHYVSVLTPTEVRWEVRIFQAKPE